MKTLFIILEKLRDGSNKAILVYGASVSFVHFSKLSSLKRKLKKLGYKDQRVINRHFLPLKVELYTDHKLLSVSSSFDEVYLQYRSECSKHIHTAIVIHDIVVLSNLNQ